MFIKISLGVLNAADQELFGTLLVVFIVLQMWLRWLHWDFSGIYLLWVEDDENNYQLSKIIYKYLAPFTINLEKDVILNRLHHNYKLYWTILPDTCHNYHSGELLF